MWIILSSANSTTEVNGVVGWSVVYKLNMKDEEIAPCGTPARMGAIDGISMPTFVTK